MSDRCTRTCPFLDCDWKYDYGDPLRSEFMAENAAELHYEREHAGRVQIQVTLEREQLLGDRDPRQIRERYFDDDDFGGWAVAHVRTEVLEESDDHSVLQADDE